MIQSGRRINIFLGLRKGREYPIKKVSAVKRKIEISFKNEGVGPVDLTEYNVADSNSRLEIQVTQDHINRGVPTSALRCAEALAFNEAGCYAIIDKHAVNLLIFPRKKLVLRVTPTLAARSVQILQDGGGRLQEPATLVFNPVTPSQRMRQRAHRSLNGKTKIRIATQSKRRKRAKRTHASPTPVPSLLGRSVFAQREA